MKFPVVSRVCVGHENSKIQKFDNLLFLCLCLYYAQNAKNGMMEVFRK